MNHTLDVVAVLAMIVPCCILSIVFARKHRPLAGVALALIKLFSTFRVGKILEEMLRSSGKRGWQMWGFEYAPAGAIALAFILAISAACIVLNLYVLIRLRSASPASAQA